MASWIGYYQEKYCEEVGELPVVSVDLKVNGWEWRVWCVRWDVEVWVVGLLVEMEVQCNALRRSDIHLFLNLHWVKHTRQQPMDTPALSVPKLSPLGREGVEHSPHAYTHPPHIARACLPPPLHVSCTLAEPQLKPQPAASRSLP